MKKSSINQSKYDKENIMRISLKLHKKNDSDIIKVLDNTNKQGSIKNLIRKAILCKK